MDCVELLRPLTPSDYEKLANSWIARDVADAAMLRRVRASLLTVLTIHSAEDVLLGELQRDEAGRLRRALELVLPELRKGVAVQ
jgi:hypothetical protein